MDIVEIVKALCLLAFGPPLQEAWARDNFRSALKPSRLALVFYYSLITACSVQFQTTHPAEDSTLGLTQWEGNPLGALIIQVCRPRPS